MSTTSAQDSSQGSNDPSTGCILLHICRCLWSSRPDICYWNARTAFKLKKCALLTTSVVSMLLIASVLQPTCLDCKSMPAYKPVQFQTARPAPEWTSCGPCTSIELSHWKWHALAGILVHLLGLLAGSKVNLFLIFVYMFAFNTWSAWLLKTDYSLYSIGDHLPSITYLAVVYIATVDALTILLMFEAFTLWRRQVRIRQMQQREVDYLSAETITSETLEFDGPLAVAEPENEARVPWNPLTSAPIGRTFSHHLSPIPSPTSAISVPIIRISPPTAESSVRRSASEIAGVSASCLNCSAKEGEDGVVEAETAC